MFEYDSQGRIVAQRRDTSIAKNVGGEYTYESGTNRLKSVAMGMGGTADERSMSDADNFVYDRDGRLVEDRSKHLTITYDWRGMPVEFKRETACNYHGHPLCDSTKLVMDYDGTGRRISKTRARKEFGGDWETELVTHYTGIGTEVRENPVNGETKVVVNLPNGLGRYMPEDASAGDFGFGAGYMPPEKFEWYLKNHLGSTMLVYGTQGYSWTDAADVGSPIAAYDYRAFGEQVSLAEPSDKVTENFTGKERDDETELDYFGARYLDPMLGMWTSVDPARQYQNPYLYAGNNPIMRIDPDGNWDGNANSVGLSLFLNNGVKPQLEKAGEVVLNGTLKTLEVEGLVAKRGLQATAVLDPEPVTRTMANMGLLGIDMLEGYLDNGSAGAVGAGTIDAVGMLVPGKSTLSRFVNQVGVEFAQSAYKDVLSNDGVLTNSCVDTELPKSLEMPQDNTRVW